MSSFFYFWDFTFYKETLCFIIFILSLCSNTLTLESIFEYMRQKLIKNMLILNFILGWSVHSSFFPFFILGWNLIPVFHSGVSSSGNEISPRQKSVNSKRHFPTDGDDFIRGRVSSQDEISRVNTLSEKCVFLCSNHWVKKQPPELLLQRCS